jgi:uncharacterized protein YbjT (DUF2867 family)
MRIAVAGGTGVVGHHAVTALAAAGHEPVVLARSQGVDIISGAGLGKALAGVSAVIDASNITTASRKKATEFFEVGTGNLVDAGRRAGVTHHVVLSIVGLERVPMGYYLAKLKHEEVALTSGVPCSVLRATQFHEFAGQVLLRVPGPIAMVPRMQTQTISAREVGAALAALAAGPAVGAAPDLAGPEVHDLADLCRQLLRVRGSRKPLLRVPLPGKVGRAMKDGALLPTSDGPRGTERFADWLAATYP